MTQRGFYGRFGTPILLLTCAVAPICLWAAAGALATNSNDVKQWLPENYKETAEFKEFVARFGVQEAVMVSWKGCTLSDDRLDALAVGLEQVPADGSSMLIGRVITGRSLMRQLTSEPLNLTADDAAKRLRGVVVGDDLKTTCAIVFVSEAGQQHRDQALARIRRVAREAAGVDESRLKLGGPTVDIVTMNNEADRLFYRYSGLAAGLSLLLALLCLRRVGYVIMLFFTALLATGLAMLIFYFTGGQMNAMLMLLPALWFILSVSGAVHFINYYRDAKHEVGESRAAGRAVRQGWLPCTLATLTTAIGIGSLVICNILPVHHFGIYAAVGLVVGLGVLLLYLPSILNWWPRLANRVRSQIVDPTSPAAAAKAPRRIDRLVDATADRVTLFLTRSHYYVVGGFILLLVLLAAGILFLKPSAKLKDYFSTESRIFRDYAWLEENLGPLVPFEVELRFAPTSPLLFEERVDLVRRVQDDIEDDQQVKTIHPTRTWSAATMAPAFPAGGGVRQIIRRRALENSLRQTFEELHYIDRLEDETEIWRVTVRVRATDDEDFQRFARAVEELVDVWLEDHAKGKQVTANYSGGMRLVAKIEDELWNVLTQSFVLAFVIIGGVMVVALRSVPAGIISMAPNLFPVAATFGVIGWLGGALDVGSIMTASVALGIAVDDTFHFLIWYTRGRNRGASQVEAVNLAYRKCGPAMTQTTLICGCGLVIFMFSGFAPAARFGGLMFAMLATALLGDLLFLPALLIGWPGRFFGKPLEPAAAPQKSSAVERSDN